MKIINNERVFLNNPEVLVMTNETFKKSLLQSEYSNLMGRVIQTLSDGFCLVRFSFFTSTKPFFQDRYIHYDDFKVISIQNNN